MRGVSLVASLVVARSLALAPPLVSLRRETVSVGGRELIRELSLDLERGDRLAILGRNGAGKSTLARVVSERVPSGGFTEDRAAAVAQRQWTGRGELALGLGELRDIDEAKRAATAGAAAPRSAAWSAPPAACHYVSFEAHRSVLRDEYDEFCESRFSAVHKRATVASYLFPEDYPSALAYVGYEPRRTRLAPLPVAYDAAAGDPALAALEAAATTGAARACLERFGLLERRHAPIHALSTGEFRKLLVVDFLLSDAAVLVLDEALDGLDAPSRAEFGAALSEALAEKPGLAVVQVAHRPEDLEAVLPTKAVLLLDGATWAAGPWADMEADARTLLANRETEAAPSRLPPRPDAKTVGRDAGKTRRRGLAVDAFDFAVKMHDVTVAFDDTLVLDGLSFALRRGANCFVLGENGSGKSTLLDLVTGDSPKGYGQDLELFGRRKGSGESIWDVKRRVGVLTPRSHMAFSDFADGAVRYFGQNGAKATSLDVVCSGFFDSVGLYDAPTQAHLAIALAWVDALGLGDLVDGAQLFGRLSLGQQKLVLLCRACVKSPDLLVLDEPTHGLSRRNRDRLLAALRVVRDDPDVAVLYVTHREEERAALGFEDTLLLKKPAARAGGS